MVALWSNGEASDDKNKWKMGECQSTVSSRQGGANCGKTKNNKQQKDDSVTWGENWLLEFPYIKNGARKKLILQTVSWMLLAVKKMESFSFMEPWTAFYGRGNSLD